MSCRIVTAPAESGSLCEAHVISHLGGSRHTWLTQRDLLVQLSEISENDLSSWPPRQRDVPFGIHHEDYHHLQAIANSSSSAIPVEIHLSRVVRVAFPPCTFRLLAPTLLPSV